MISCHTYDYVEIACLYHFTIKLKLVSGDVVMGKAITTQYNSNKEECIVIESATGSMQLVLTDIVTMSACEANPHFNCVSF